MSREIIFRAKSKSTNTWLYGDLLRNELGAFAVVPPFKMNMSNECNLYEVDEETVGQFTGLTDKNGKEIYEGDIVTFTKEIINGVIFQEKGFVKYRPDCAMFVLQSDTGDEILSYCTRHIEVIGTIYDNANLLEE